MCPPLRVFLPIATHQPSSDIEKCPPGGQSPFHTQWLIDPIPLESDKTLTNGSAACCWESLRPVSVSACPSPIMAPTGFDQWFPAPRRSGPHGVTIKRAGGYCFLTIRSQGERKLHKTRVTAISPLGPYTLPCLLADPDWSESFGWLENRASWMRMRNMNSLQRLACRRCIFERGHSAVSQSQCSETKGAFCCSMYINNITTVAHKTQFRQLLLKKKSLKKAVTTILHNDALLDSKENSFSFIYLF